MPQLTEYRFGHLVVDGREHDRDVIVLPERVVGAWWRVDGHSLCLDDLADVLDDLPPHLVVGTGSDGRMQPEAEVLEQLRARGIDVEVLRTPEAVRRYGELDPATTAAALHLTC
ncbi:MAG TPA: MTH938/NDUFAF3 family protein [Actinomycetota bacterium]